MLGFWRNGPGFRWRAKAFRASILALTLLSVLAFTGSALAHAIVLETSPEDGVLLDTAPDFVVVLFNEPVSLVRAQVLDAAGTDITPSGPITLTRAELRIALPAELAPGSYVASYRVVSSDSHPIAGSIIFSIGQVSGTVATPLGASEDLGWRTAYATIRAVLFAAILGAAGGALFLGLVLSNGATPEYHNRTTISLFAAVGCVAAFLAVGVQGGLLVNGPPRSLLDAETWRIGVTSRYGRTAIAALVGLALVFGGVRAPPASALRFVAWPGAALALASFSLSGHVITSGPRWLTIPTLIAHTTAAAFWAGSLVPLGQVLVRGEGAAAILERFSRIAVVAVGVLAVAGTIIAVLQVRSPSALLTTPYGLTLSLKLALVVGLISLAALNKLRLTPALARGEPSALPALRGTIAAELALILGILVATGVLGTRPPPRVIAEGAAHVRSHGAANREGQTGLVVTLLQERNSAEIELGSAWSGVTRARIAIRDASGSPLEAQEVTFIASNPGAGVEPIRRLASRAEDGAWKVDNLLLAPAGRWTLRVEALISDFEMATFETRIELLSPNAASGT